MENKEGRIKGKITFFTCKHPIISTIICFVMIFLFACIIATFITSTQNGDIYLFPENLIRCEQLKNNPSFKEYIENKGFEVIYLNGLTADKHGPLWVFYIKVKIDASYDERNINHLDHYWDFHTNGDIYYNVDDDGVGIRLL